MAKTGPKCKYEPAMAETALNLFKKGASIAEIRLELDICHETFTKWRKDFPDFGEAVNKGLDMSKGWWEKLGREGACGEKEVPPALYVINMRNRFGKIKPTEDISWSDKQEIEHSGNLTFSKIIKEIQGDNNG